MARQAPSPPAEGAAPAVEETRVTALADHLFRHEAGRLVSILTGIFGIERLQLAEDVVQEALLRALKTWPFYGVPTNPTGWLMQTAKHLALDAMRRERTFAGKRPQIIAFLEQRMEVPFPGASMDEIEDDRLKLMFACCHPSLPQDAQTALALKTVCGFSPVEIAKAFLVSEAAVAKRLTRARRHLQDENVPFEIPTGSDLPARLDGVLYILYLLFNEGYKASGGDTIVREDLCHEAVRLTRILTAHPVGNQPAAHALLALMLLNGSRLPARVDGEGNLVLMAQQDRQRWDTHMIRQGMLHLQRAASGDTVNNYHLEAAIAACHCLATSEEETDWSRILTLYDQLLARCGSPVVALNRAVAVARLHGPDAAVALLKELLERDQLDEYHLLYGVLGHLEMERNRFRSAAGHFRRALSLAESFPERAFLEKRLEECHDRLYAANELVEYP